MNTCPWCRSHLTKAAADRLRASSSRGGKARAKALSPARRHAIAQKAARARWGAK